jgi:mono/diheme cytochrome c family protein
VQRITLLLGALMVAAATLPAQQSAAPAGITPAMIARGDSIYHGQIANGTCSACHGPEGHGVPGLTNDLTSPKRINGDGSYVSLMQIVREGVPKPKQGVPMPPHGGAQLTPLDIHAVAAYVYSLSHPRR